MIKNKINIKKMEEYNEMDEIIDNLYIGDFFAAKDVQFLKKKGIEKVLTIMCDRCPNYNDNEFIHKKYDIADFSGENIIQYFGECLKFIKGDQKTLVHCMAGASRSATIVIAYLMWTLKMKFLDALEYTKKKRPMVDPNCGFKEQLKMFEKLLIDNDYDIDKIDFKQIKWGPTKQI